MAIAPFTPGVALSLDANKATDLSLTQGDLAAIATGTLALGSLDGTAPAPTATGGLAINTGVDLGGIANTLALFNLGDVTEAAGAGVTVPVLVGSAPNFALSGSDNHVQAIGSTATNGGGINILVASNDLLLVNAQDLAVVTTASAGGSAEIDVLGGNLTVDAGAVVQAANAYLRAGSDTVGGSVIMSGTVAASDVANLVAGFGYARGGFTPGVTGSASAGTISIGGTLSAPAIGLYSANDTTETGVIAGASGGAASLTGEAGLAATPGNVSLTGLNSIGTLGAISASAITLNDGTDLTIAGPVSASSFRVNDGTGVLTLANGAVIRTGGVARPSGNLPGGLASLPTYAAAANGAYFEAGSFIQLGTSTVEPLNGGPTTIRLDITTPGGNASFGGFEAPSADLILALTGGRATGPINVAALDVSYLANGAGGSQLTGLVNGVGGVAAAGQSHIYPQPSPQYQINGCPLATVNCVILPQVTPPVLNPVQEILLSVLGVPGGAGNDIDLLPVLNPLQDISSGVLGGTGDDIDLLLPDVVERDY